MKLWIKIFSSILLVSLSTLFLSTSYVINKSHIANIRREQDRSLNEFELIQLSVRNSMNVTASSDDTLRMILSRLDDYYSNKDITLLLYQGDHYIYNEFNSIDKEVYQELLTIREQDRMIQVFEQNKQQFIMTSGLLSENNNTILLYARDISVIYQEREKNVQLSIALAMGFTLVLIALSYLYSKWITKPIVLLQTGALAISHGDYSIRIEETKDEFRDLALAFNTMASAVEGRTYELEAKAKELQVFIDDLSHEMNTPLTSIQGYADFLQNANATEEQRMKAANTIRSQAKRMKDIYTKLMTLTLAREHKIEQFDTPVEPLFTDIKDTFDIQLKERGITLISHITLDQIKMDRTFIYILLSNLIKNSLQSIQKESKIILRAYEEYGCPILAVEDHGFGIPKDKIDDVIKPFVRVDKSRSRKTGGAGLGLSICKSIANLHHGELKIESEVGVGTKVKMIFPPRDTSSDTIL